MSVSGHTNWAVFCSLSNDSAVSRWNSSIRFLETGEWTRHKL